MAASATSPLLSPSNEVLPVDHYAILELDPQASTDDIKAAYRRLRVVYFQSDAKKYRALQAAFDTLLDPEARQAYDSSGAARVSSSLTSLGGTGGTGETGETGESKHERKDSVTGTDGVMTTVSEEEEDMEDPQTQRHDPNWALKRHQRRHNHLIGTQRYWSHIPMASRYNRRDTDLLACRRPTYLGQFAIMACPN